MFHAVFTPHCALESDRMKFRLSTDVSRSYRGPMIFFNLLVKISDRHKCCFHNFMDIMPSYIKVNSILVTDQVLLYLLVKYTLVVFIIELNSRRTSFCVFSESCKTQANTCQEINSRLSSLSNDDFWRYGYFIHRRVAFEGH